MIGQQYDNSRRYTYLYSNIYPVLLSGLGRRNSLVKYTKYLLAPVAKIQAVEVCYSAV